MTAMTARNTKIQSTERNTNGLTHKTPKFKQQNEKKLPFYTTKIQQIQIAFLVTVGMRVAQSIILNLQNRKSRRQDQPTRPTQ